MTVSPRSALVWHAICDCGICLSYSLTFLVFGQALHQATGLENLVQLFNAESHAIGIKPVHGIDGTIAKYVYFLPNLSKNGMYSCP